MMRINLIKKKNKKKQKTKNKKQKINFFALFIPYFLKLIIL
jgi:hypothetical protein